MHTFHQLQGLTSQHKRPIRYTVGSTIPNLFEPKKLQEAICQVYQHSVKGKIPFTIVTRLGELNLNLVGYAL